MTTQEIKELVRTVYDAYNERDFGRSAAVVADDVELINVATGQVFRGREGFLAFLNGWATAFPDSKVEVVGLKAAEDGASVEFFGRGTHTGPLAGPAGTIPPTGRRVDVRFHDAWEVRNGRIASGRTYFDLATMLGQLGVLPPPAPAALDLTGVPIGESASAASYRRLVEELFNRGNEAVVDELIAPDAVDHDPVPGFPEGREGLKAMVRAFRAAFPDGRTVIDELFVADDRVVARYTYTGTHQGELFGIAPTGRRVTAKGIDIVRAKGSTLVEHWGAFDQLALLQQLGAAPQPAGS